MKALYDSGFHHPLAAYVANLALLLLLVVRGKSMRPFVRAFLFVFTAEILADALVTGAWSPIASTSGWFSPLSVLFVILGDLRYFLVVSRLARAGDTPTRVTVTALALSLIVPVVTGVLSRVIPAMAQNPRILFLVYELMLFAIVAAFRRHTLPRARPTDGDELRFVREISLFELVQYAGWAIADIVILSGFDVGYLLRILPNVMYYAFFLLVVFFRAPRMEPAA